VRPAAASADASARACAEIRGSFVEAAPFERLEIESRSRPGVAIAGGQFGFGASTGALMFDSEAGGAGVGVPAAFKSVDGLAILAQTPQIVDGAADAALIFSSFPAGARYRFGADLDAPDGGSTRVRPSDLAGGAVAVRLSGAVDETLTGRFDGSATLTLGGGVCASS